MTDLESDDQALACDWLNVRADEDFRTNHAVSLSPLFVFFFFFFLIVAYPVICSPS